MAAIKNLDLGFSKWEPIGIPIAPLMQLEDRKGKLALVLERSVVDLESTAFKTAKALREEWLSAGSDPDDFRRPGASRFTDDIDQEKPMILKLNALKLT